MSEAPDTLPAPPPSEPPLAVAIPPARPVGRTAADERIDVLLDRIEPLLERIPVSLEASARESAHMRAAFDDLTAEVSRYNGKQSALEMKIDVLALQLKAQNEYFEATKEVFEFVKELRAGFAVFWSHASKLAAGTATPTEAEAHEHDAEIVALRPGQQQQ